ncbi:AsmA family protein [Edaphobacter modestus]|nr:AsmA family protein [Edaphobacter modestus]
MQFNKRALKIAGIAVAAVVVILIALPLFININSFRPKIESELTSALGRPVTLGEMSFSLFSGNVGVKNVSIADDPAFSKSPFITMKSLEVGVEVMPLIFSKQLSITGIELEEPQITLLRASDGTWNFSSIGGANKNNPPDPAKSGGSQNLSIAKLEIKDGKLSVGKVNSTAKPQVYDKLNAEVSNFSLASQFPFGLTINLPGGGDAKLTGRAGPINPQDSAKTPFDAPMKVRGLDLAASGFVDPGSGIAGSVDLEGTLNSNGSQAKAVGTITCEKLKLSPKGSPSPKVVTVKYAIDEDLDRQVGTITQGDIAIGKSVARLTGGFQAQGETQVMNLKLSAPNMSVDELEALLPALGVMLPSGSKLNGGTLSADLAISGSLDNLVIAGPVRMSNTKLAGFDMGSKLGALPAFSGKASSNPDTTIQNASLNARIAPDVTRADAINVTMPSLGVVTGAGTISPNGALDFSMIADLQTNRSEARAERTGRGGDQGGVSFRIQGTTSNPSFVADVGSLAGNVAKGAIQRSVSEKTGDKTGGILPKRRPR